MSKSAPSISLIRLADGYAKLEPIASGSKRSRGDAILEEPFVDQIYIFRRTLDVCFYLILAIVQQVDNDMKRYKTDLPWVRCCPYRPLLGVPTA